MEICCRVCILATLSILGLSKYGIYSFHLSTQPYRGGPSCGGRRITFGSGIVERWRYCRNHDRKDECGGRDSSECYTILSAISGKLNGEVEHYNDTTTTIDGGGSSSNNINNKKDVVVNGDSVQQQRHNNHHKQHQPQLFANGEAIQRIGGYESAPTVWTEFARLSRLHEVANLGQGFPDWSPPQFAVDSLVEATLYSSHLPHQYTRTEGHPNLVKQLARRYSTHLQQDIDPMSEIAVTVGASQALYLSLQAVINPGDEVILFEPFFDLYVNQVKLAGGKPIFVPLTFVPYDSDETTLSGGEWVLDREKLESAVTSRTKAVVLNSPHNPTGKVFTLNEMEFIADVVSTHPGCVVLSDEVYKYIIHSQPQDDRAKSIESPLCGGHIHFASLPGMWDRTITISSAGKTFSATGWQVGWAIGPKRLLAPIRQLMPYVQFCASTVMQESLAKTLVQADKPFGGYGSYYEYLKATYTRKRDLLGSALKEAGFAIPNYDVTPGGGFFIFARIGSNIRQAIPPERINAPNPAAPGGIARQDWALCQWMAEEKGILCIPSSPFFSEKSVQNGASDEFVRIAFCKTDKTIQDAAKALRVLVSKNNSSSKDEA